MEENCIVCFKERKDGEFAHLTECRCSLCVDRMTVWLSAQVNEGEIFIKCANPYCGQEATSTDLQRYLNAEDYNRYHTRLALLETVALPLTMRMDRMEDLGIAVRQNQMVQIIINIVQVTLMAFYFIFMGIKHAFFR